MKDFNMINQINQDQYLNFIAQLITSLTKGIHQTHKLNQRRQAKMHVYSQKLQQRVLAYNQKLPTLNNTRSQQRLTQMQSQSKNNESRFQDEKHEQIVLFKYKRAFRDQSFDQIKIHSKKIKPNPQLAQQATDDYKKRNFIDRQTMLTDLFQKLQLSQKQPQSQTKAKNTSLDIFQQKKERKAEYFLKKVDFGDVSSDLINEEKRQNDVSEIRNQARNIRMQVRRQGLEKKLDRVRQINCLNRQNKRIKYKIIDIKKQNIVNFNGQSFEYQDLSKQYGPNQIANNDIYDYYVLSKGKASTSSNYPEIILPQEAEYLLQQQQNNGMRPQTPQDSQEDSNRQDRSDYDYPEEEYHEGDSDKESEGIISGKGSNDRSYGSEDNGDMRNSYQEEDQEEYYRQYLKRCKRKDQGDDQLTYLYNLKPTKYDSEDSDD